MLRTNSLLGPTLALVAMGAVACSASGVDPVENDDRGDGGASTTTTTGGGPGGGGTGGSGGESPCAMDCSSIDPPDCHVSVCNTGEHPGTVGTCVVVPAADGSGCDDGLFCTTNDACQAGACVGGPENDCGMDPGPCDAIVCDESAKACGTEPLANGTACTPENLCQVGGQCTNGTCVGEPKDCFFAPVPNDCHDAVCNPQNGLCEPVPAFDGEPCTDENDLCTVGKTCSAGSCEGGSPKSCSALNVGCQVGVCDVATGQCTGQAVPDGGLCDDNDPCTTGEICTAGVCSGGNTETMCMPGDLCCPAGCDETNDSDCSLDILLLGDDVIAAEWDAYRQALQAAGETWTEHNLDVITTFPTLAELNAYNTIIWFDENTLIQTEAEVQVVVDWLNASAGDRHLFVNGVDFLWDMQNGTSGELNMYQAMGVSYAGDYAGTTITILEAVPGDPITGAFSPGGLTLGGTTDSNGDYASATAGPATHGAFYGPGGTGSGASGLSHYDTGTYKLVWLGVNFHNGLTSQPQRNQLMQNITTWFKN